MKIEGPRIYIKVAFGFVDLIFPYLVVFAFIFSFLSMKNAFAIFSLYGMWAGFRVIPVLAPFFKKAKWQ
ncbi:hypothetical protein D3C86_1964920 [compost metagenome]